MLSFIHRGKKIISHQLFMFDCVKCSCSYSISFVTLGSRFPGWSRFIAI